MSTRFAGLRPGLVPALVKVAIIGSWRGRTFLHDNERFDDIADFVPASVPGDEPVGDLLPALDERGRAERALIEQLRAEQAMVEQSRAGHAGAPHRTDAA